MVSVYAGVWGGCMCTGGVCACICVCGGVRVGGGSQGRLWRGWRAGVGGEGRALGCKAGSLGKWGEAGGWGEAETPVAGVLGLGALFWAALSLWGGDLRCVVRLSRGTGPGGGDQERGAPAQGKRRLLSQDPTSLWVGDSVAETARTRPSWGLSCRPQGPQT